MEMPVAPSFLPLIQLAITPVILLSGVGALMLTLTNRMARIVDRTRSLAGQVQSAVGEERPHLVTQLEILWHRAGLIRLAVTLAGLSMLFSCGLVLVILVDAVLQRDFGFSLVAVFVVSIGCLIASLLAFLRDIWLSLRAVQLEVEKAREKS